MSSSTPRFLALVLVVTVGLSVSGPAASGALLESGAATSQQTEPSSHHVDTRPATQFQQEPATLERTTTLELTPDTPGEVTAVVSFDVPDDISELSVVVESKGEVVATAGFRGVGDRRYNWTATDQTPQFTMTIPVNESDRGTASGESGSSYIDSGEWAITPLPRFSTYWKSSSDIELATNTRADGSGVAGTAMAYLGPYESHTRQAGGQELRLLVPDAASLVESPDSILDSVAHASETLQAGARDDGVLLIAAPATGDWSSEGLQVGDREAWVTADSELDVVTNTWVHEYVHTRQAFDASRSTQWLYEGSAEYYAALFSYQQGRISFDAFEDHLGRGSQDPYEDTILAQPRTWTSGSQYLKGGLVFGTLDRTTRLETDGRHTAGDVLRRVNEQYEERPEKQDQQISNTDFFSAIEAVAGQSVATDMDPYVTERSAPAMWRRSEHAEAFSTDPPSFRYQIGGYETDSAGYRVTGPYGSLDSETLPSVYAGETLTLPIGIENVGGVTGSYEGRLELNGDPAAESVDGTLEPGERTVVTTSVTLEAAGTQTLSIGYDQRELEVLEPAAATVSELDIDQQEVEAGDSVTATATVENENSIPGRVVLEFQRDGQTVSRQTVGLAANSSTTVEMEITLEDPGEHVISVAGREETVNATDSGIPLIGQPGFGVAPAIGVLLIGLLSRIVRSK